MRKKKVKLAIEPVGKKSLLTVLATLKPLNNNFPPTPDKPPKPVKF